MARLPYVDQDSATPEVREVFRKLNQNGARILNPYRMLGHSRARPLQFIKLGKSMMAKAGLDGKLREIVIPRMALLTGRDRLDWPTVP